MVDRERSSSEQPIKVKLRAFLTADRSHSAIFDEKLWIGWSSRMLIGSAKSLNFFLQVGSNFGAYSQSGNCG